MPRSSPGRDPLGLVRGAHSTHFMGRRTPYLPHSKFTGTLAKGAEKYYRPKLASNVSMTAAARKMNTKYVATRLAE